MDAGNALDVLWAIEQIKRLKARYFRCMDTKDWAGFEALFADDAVFDMRSGRGDGADPDAIRSGAADIAAFVRAAVDPLVTIHHGYMPEIEVLTADTARGTWAMEDVLLVPEGVSMPFRRMHGYGHYHEEYVRRDGRWLIGSLRLTRLAVHAV